MVDRIKKRCRFYRKDLGHDYWPEVKAAIENEISHILGEQLEVVVEKDSPFEVVFMIQLSEKHLYYFGNLYDCYLRTHHLDL